VIKRSLIILSINLHIIQVNDKGLYLDADDGEPLLNTSVTIEEFQIVGNVDNSYDVMNSSDRGIAREPATFLKTVHIVRPELHIMFMA